MSPRCSLSGRSPAANGSRCGDLRQSFGRCVLRTVTIANSAATKTCWQRRGVRLAKRRQRICESECSMRDSSGLAGLADVRRICRQLEGSGHGTRARFGGSALSDGQTSFSSPRRQHFANRLSPTAVSIMSCDSVSTVFELDAHTEPMMTPGDAPLRLQLHGRCLEASAHAQPGARGDRAGPCGCRRRRVRDSASVRQQWWSRRGHCTGHGRGRRADCCVD